MAIRARILDKSKGQTLVRSSREKDIPRGAQAEHYVNCVSELTQLCRCDEPHPLSGEHHKPYETHTVTWLHQQEVLKLILDACEA